MNYTWTNNIRKTYWFTDTFINNFVLLWKKGRLLSPLSIAQPITSQVFQDLFFSGDAKPVCCQSPISGEDRWSLITFFFNFLVKAIGKHCRSLQSVVLSQCGSLSSKGVSSLASKCRQLKMLDVAMTKVINTQADNYGKYDKQKICNVRRNEFSCTRQVSL